MAASQFPDRFPIFPLNVVLFPDVYLPLRMFEPRYRALTRDVLLGQRVIGMTLLKSGNSAPAVGPAHVFEVGCAGRITREQEARDDSMHHILLEGRRRFRLLDQELTQNGYILARVELLDDPSFDELDHAVRAELSAVRPELEQRMLEYVQTSTQRGTDKLREGMRELDPVGLVHAIAFRIDCGLIEKQGLLEASNPLERARLLIQLLDFQLADARLPERPQSIN